MTIVQTADGSLQGFTEGGVTRFRGVRYARAARFEAPVAESPWSDIRPALDDGPMCPQPRFELAIMGLADATTELDEDCFFLTVTLPDAAPEPVAPRPVMVWIHGGSYINGTGAGEYYDTGRIALDGDVIVVAINYRLGAFGYLHVDGQTDANLGVLDQLEALRWVQRNIASFGGDPDNVTIFGQSAGADAIAYLLAIPEADELYSRAIMQSAPLGLDVDRESIARQLNANFSAALVAAGTDAHDATTEQLLEAQTTARLGLKGNRLTLGMPYAPIPGEGIVPARAELAARWRARAPQVEVIVGYNRDDSSPFLDAVPLIERLRQSRSIRKPGILTRWLTDRIFAAPALRLAALLADAGATVFTYRFDWRPQGTPWGACHTLELPFFFGPPEQWTHSPMLAGAEWADVDAFGRRLRTAWASFARSGSPAVAGAGTWHPFDSASPIGIRLDLDPRYS